VPVQAKQWHDCRFKMAIDFPGFAPKVCVGANPAITFDKAFLKSEFAVPHHTVTQ
jgi:hypothetical protein